MKSIKKSLAASLIFIMVLSLIGCGTADPAMNEDVNNSANMQESEMPTDEINNRAEDIKDGDVATTDKPAEATASPEPADTPKPTETSKPTAPPEPTATPEPTPPSHVHQWSETVTRAAGCSTEGEKKLTCECGDVKVESIPATGEHNWVEGTTVIHHEELGHVEQVQTGTTAGYTTYACAVCGAEFDTPSGVVDHCAAFVPDLHGMANTIAYDHPGEPIYENQWKIDQPAWDETVGTGTYTCSVCGATK